MKKQAEKHHFMFRGVLLLLLAGCIALGGCRKSADAQIRIGALKGPTTIGLLRLMEEAEAGNTKDEYTFTMAVGADELTPLLAKGELDIALLPANVAAVLYQKTEGGICVIDINTLGVLYMVSGSEAIASIQDLRGQTICLTGRGTTPDYVLQYLLEKNGIALEEVTLDYRSEATEVAAVLAENPEAAARFLEAHEASTFYAADNPADAAALCVKAEIIAKEAVAEKAIPFCNMTCIKGEEMRQALSGYLSVLYEQNPEAVGGSLPDSDFYFIGE